MLNLRNYLIKEHAGLMKLKDKYDIIDPEANELIGHAQEEISQFTQIMRLLISKKWLPTVVRVYEKGNKEPVFEIYRGVALFSPRVEVRTGDGIKLGYFKTKFFSLGGGFYLYDTKDRLFAEVKGDWKGWNFKLVAENGTELGTISKKWAGFAKELFTSADNYMISLSKDADDTEIGVMMLLAAGLAIDTVFKEGNN